MLAAVAGAWARPLQTTRSRLLLLSPSSALPTARVRDRRRRRGQLQPSASMPASNDDESLAAAKAGLRASMRATLKALPQTVMDQECELMSGLVLEKCFFASLHPRPRPTSSHPPSALTHKTTTASRGHRRPRPGLPALGGRGPGRRLRGRAPPARGGHGRHPPGGAERQRWWWWWWLSTAAARRPQEALRARRRRPGRGHAPASPG
jgi:hypothetical protein